MNIQFATGKKRDVRELVVNGEIENEATARWWSSNWEALVDIELEREAVERGWRILKVTYQDGAMFEGVASQVRLHGIGATVPLIVTLGVVL